MSVISQVREINTSVGDTRGPWDRQEDVNDTSLTNHSPDHSNTPNHPLQDTSGVVFKTKEDTQSYRKKLQREAKKQKNKEKEKKLNNKEDKENIENVLNDKDSSVSPVDRRGRSGKGGN